MKRSVQSILSAAVLAGLFATGGVLAQTASSSQAQDSVMASSGDTLKPNQTRGFGAGQRLIFTYTQNYDCIHEPRSDLDYNGKPAQSDPGEFQTPVCQAATEPSIDPTGANIKQSEPLYVLVPMFSLDNDKNANDAIPCPAGVRPTTLCGPALGNTLVSLFGAIPEAYKKKPLVSTQCPDPGSPPGTCTMHASSIDLGKVLVALGKLPPSTRNVFLPTPNHSHVVNGDAIRTRAIWWQVIPVLVTDPNCWPSASGSMGITSTRKLHDAERRGNAIEVPSNFFLFFKSEPMRDMD
ncbi:MAG TPA: hypothetical protein VGU03_02135 [Frateuria sp.]|uniref:hypothetical protein n=1 Tax=Frateuria sp. TaxID=2211372 RepID=UPI002DF347BE|nr:hypothetical protein [Frateuria sp.]